MQNIGVIGTGIWGTALALTATRRKQCAVLGSGD